MSNVERIQRIAAELGLDNVVVIDRNHPEVKKVDEVGGVCYAFWTGLIIMVDEAMDEYSDGDLRVLLAHESGHDYYLESHKEVVSKGMFFGPKATFKEFTRIELEADSYAISLLGGYKFQLIYTVCKLSIKVISKYPVAKWPLLWSIQIFTQIIPRAINIALA